MTNENLDSKGNLVFQWMCANKAGRIDSLLETICWFANSSSSYAAKKWIFALSSLGHCDVDWGKGTWRVASSRLIRLPNSDGITAYIGYRKNEWGTALEDVGAYVEDQAKPQFKSILELPQSVFFLIDSNSQIKEIAKALEAAYIPDAALVLADSLDSLSSLSRLSRPPAFSSELDKLEVKESAMWTKQLSTKSLLRDGIYRTKEASGKKFYEKIGDDWKVLDSSVIHFRELSRTNRNPLQYIEDTSRPGMGDLYIPDFINFPLPHLRALTLCSGRIADDIGVSNEVCYANIQASVYEKVSFALMN